jgi:hypothetical protein
MRIQEWLNNLMWNIVVLRVSGGCDGVTGCDVFSMYLYKKLPWGTLCLSVTPRHTVTP